MSSPLRRLLTIAAAASIVAVVAGTAWAQARPRADRCAGPRRRRFRMPEEELYGTVINGKLYVLGGFGVGGNAPDSS